MPGSCRDDGAQPPASGPQDSLLAARAARSTALSPEEVMERARLYEAERRSRLHLEAILTGLPIGVIVAEAPGGRLIFGNRWAHKVFGPDWRDSSGVEEYRSWNLSYLDGRLCPPGELPLARALRGEVVEGEELMSPRSDGSWLYARVNAAPIRDEQGEIMAAVLTFEDRTLEKHHEEELQQARAAARQASRAKSDFLAVMSHELRTPLNAILGYADLLGSGIYGSINEKQEEQIGRIKSGATHLVGMIDEILTISSLEGGREPVRLEPVDVARLAGECVDLVRPRAESKGIVLRSAGSEDPLMMETDRDKVRQILLNLLVNAIKFTELGTVTLAVSADGEARVNLRIVDTGPGIPEDQIERIFEPFTQVDGSRTRTKGGAGLGLTVCRRLARLLGGDVMAESTPGEGSAFTLRLPLRSPVPAGTGKPAR